MIKAYLARMDEHMQEVIKGASSAMLIQVFGTLLGFLVSVSVARLLGAEGVGIYFLALSVTTIAATVGQFGFDNTVVRFIASHASTNEWDEVRYINRTAIRVVTVVSLLITIALFFSADWIATTLFSKPFMVLPLQIAAVAVLPLALAMIQADSLRGLKSIAASQWVKTVFISLGTLILLYPFVQMWGANGAVVAYTVAIVLSSVVAWGLWRKTIYIKADAVSDTQGVLTLQTLFQSSWPLFGVALTGLAIQQAATIFLGVWGSAEEVGIFSVANRIAGLLLFPLLAMITILAPKFAAMHKQADIDGLRSLARNTSGILTLITVPVVIFISFSSKWVLGIFGPEFTRGVMVLDILLIGVVINAVTGPVTNILMMSGHETEVRRVMITSVLILVVLCVLLMPGYGMVGTAVAVLVGSSIQNCYMTVKVRRLLGFWPVALLRK